MQLIIKLLIYTNTFDGNIDFLMDFLMQFPDDLGLNEGLFLFFAIIIYLLIKYFDVKKH